MTTPYHPPTITDHPSLIIYPTPNQYPAEWPALAKTIKDLAGWQCEHCGHPHNVATGHVLTVHHINGLKHDCRYSNLVALCQRCHLHIQHRYRPDQPRLIGPRPAWAAVRGLP